ncbi:MAG: response regulator [Chitinivibrionales bacterium]|nr:response regulator [Chitinivibrionales bacterium]
MTRMLPLPAEITACTSIERALMSATTPARVLIIDDEMSICLAVCDILDMNGHHCEHCLTAEEGIEYLRAHTDIDVVLLDINLGHGMDGIEALPVIKDMYKYIQVIMFTSKDTLECGIEAMKKGAFDYITKPFEEEGLVKKVLAAVENRKMLQLNDLYLGILVHDLKNPLQCITGALEFIKEGAESSGDSMQKKFIGVLEGGVNQISMMINNILSVTKFESGTLSPVADPFVLERVVNPCLQGVLDEAETSGRTFAIAYADGCGACTINADKDFFSRVLVNIAGNALRFTPKSGEISVAFEVGKNDFLHVSVTNTGSFIEEEKRELVFHKFVGVRPDAGPHKSQNFGLGLTYSKMAVEAMDGRIWIEGNPEVPQTTFHFTIKNHTKGG